MPILDNVTVLDLSRVFAAPFATQMLSDLGARVWKVESLRGDDSRKWGQHVFNAFNRGKKSLALNLKDARAQAIVRRLAQKSDVMVENFKTGDLARYGLSHAELSRLNERLVTLSLTGFGHTGPRAHQPGYDTIIQAMTGVMTLTGESDGPPTRVGIAWIDVMSGLTTAVAILAALRERDRSGHGQHIDLSLFDVGLMALVDVAQDYLEHGHVQRRIGNVTRNISPAQVFRTSDGWITVAVGNDDQFARLCQALGCDSASTDARFRTNPDRILNRSPLSDLLIPLFQRGTRDHWVGVLNAAKVPVSPIFDVAEAFADQQTGARGAVWSMATTGGATLPAVASPFRHFSRTPATPQGPPPGLGEHTAALLQDELGMAPADIDALVRDGVVRLTPEIRKDSA
jgi:crotonobetainyl-CoA:carnitine CoA-transferase CaiB-like acyl-CoA transferase